jgi:membrane dipeptidase
MKRRTKRVLWSVVGAALLLALLGFTLLPRILGSAMNGVLEHTWPAPSAEAVRLQSTLAVADLHSDALLWNRDLLERGSYGHVDIPRMIEGRIALQAFTTVTKTPKSMNIEANAGDSDNITMLAMAELWPMRTWGSLAERALFQASKLRRTAARSEDRFRVITTRGELEEFLRKRDTGEAATAGFLGIEGAHALEGELGNVDRLYEAGFRMFGLTHFFDNEVGGSAHGVEKGGLTPFGREVIARMETLHIAIDLAHAAPALIDDVLDLATTPIIVSHTGVKGTCNNRRNLDDGRLTRIAATGGVVGIGLWPTAVCGETPSAWALAVRHAAEVAGVDHVGLGSDWDGAVTTIVDATGTTDLTQALLDEGFESDDIRKIMGGNVIRVLRETLPAGPGGR